MRKRQAGFSAVEAIIVGVIVLALIGIGFWVFKERSKEGKTDLSASESVEAPSAPSVDTVSDLTSVEKSLDTVNLEAGTSDNADLDTQSSGF